MSWLLALSILAGLVIIPVVWPLLISCDLFPFLLRVSWPGLAFEYSDSPRLVILGKKISLEGKKKDKEEPKAQAKKEESKPKKAKKPKKSKKKKSLKKMNLQLLKDLWELQTGQIVVKRVVALLTNIIKSFSIKKLTGNIGSLDYYQSGVLYGLLEAVPNHKKLDLKANFTGDQTVNVAIRLSLAKLLIAIFRFLVTFPYLKSWRLYNFLYQPKNASKTK